MQMIRRADLARNFGMSGCGFMKMVERTPDFPRPVKVGDGRTSPVMFVLSEVEAWIEKRKAEGDKKGQKPAVEGR